MQCATLNHPMRQMWRLRHRAIYWPPWSIKHCHETDLVKLAGSEVIKPKLNAGVQRQQDIATRQIVAKALADVPHEILIVPENKP